MRRIWSALAAVLIAGCRPPGGEAGTPEERVDPAPRPGPSALVWSQRGGPVAPTYAPTNGRRLDVDNAGTAFALSSGLSPDGLDAVRAYQLGADGWRPLGDPLRGPSACGGCESTGSAAIAADGRGGAWVAWVERGYGSDQVMPHGTVHVAHWEGTAWARIEGPAASQPDFTFDLGLDLRVDPAGRLVLAWSTQGTAPGGVAHAARLEAGGWAALDADLAPGGATSPQLAFEPGGEPVLAYLQGGADGHWHVHVERWTGGRWSPLPASVPIPGWADERFGFAIDSSGAPAVAVAYAQPSGGSSPPPGGTGTVRVVRWDGGAWAEVGVFTDSSDSYARGVSLTATPTGLAVAWTEWASMAGVANRVEVRAWSGGAWIPAGEAFTNARVPALATAPDGNLLLLVDQQLDGNTLFASQKAP